MYTREINVSDIICAIVISNLAAGPEGKRYFDEHDSLAFDYNVNIEYTNLPIEALDLHRLAILDHTGKRNCQPVRQTVRFQIQEALS